MRPGRDGIDEAEGDRPMQGMRDGRPTERKRYETAVLVLCRQVLVYRPIQTPSNTVSELCTLPEQGCSSRCASSNELPLTLSHYQPDLDLFERNSVFPFITVC